MANDKQELKAVLEGNANFTKDIYNILSGSSGNIFFSPISAHILLSMAYQGAKGPTKEAFSTTIHIPEPAVAAEGYSSMMPLLNNIRGVELHIANKIYINEGYTFLAPFKETVQNKFHSEVDQLIYTNTVHAAGVINSWVKRKTNNKINDIISPDSLDGLTRAVLINAIYFKGEWLEKFDPRSTRTEKFYLNNKDSVYCQMMFKKDEYMFKNDEILDAKVLEIPFKNKDISLVIILPNKRDGIHNLEAKLTNTDFTKITEGMYKQEVDVYLPKFKIETTINLNEVLSKMGLGIIFDPAKANFTGMIDSPDPIYVSEVIQKAFIEVNEEGAEAAAATCLEFVDMCYFPPINFNANHPFIMALCVRENNSRNILFKGRLSNPSNEIVKNNAC